MRYDIAIIGGGTSGWLAAAYLAYHHPGKTICLVESPRIPTIGVGEGTFPTTMSMLAEIGIDTREFIIKANAGVKLGIHYVDFAAKPFWLGTATFKDWERWGGDMTRRVALGHCCPPLTSTSVYACHFVADDFAALLRSHAVDRLGVTHIAAEVTDTCIQDNHCTSISLSNGDVITATWFIDSSGFSRVLVKGTEDNPFVSYKDQLLVDSAIVGPTPYVDKHSEFTSHTEIKGLTSGWKFKIPTYTRRGNGYVYSSRFQDSESAEAELRMAVPELEGVKHLTMGLGYYKKLFVGNIAAVGLSGGFIEPMEATAIYLTERTLIEFNQILRGEKTQDQANLFMQNKIKYVKTLILAHYAFTNKTSSPFWIEAQRAAYTSPEIQEFFGGLQNKKFPTHRDTLDLSYPYPPWNDLLRGFGQPHYYPTISNSAQQEIEVATYRMQNHFDCIEQLRNSR